MRLPKLNRKGRILRNLLLALLVSLTAWAALGFAPPTDALAAKWEAARYGLGAPQILTVTPKENNPSRHELILRWEDGRLGTLCTYRKLLFFRRAGTLELLEAQDGGGLLMVPGGALTPEAIYVWTEIPETAKAECRLRIRAKLGVSFTDMDTGYHEGSHHDWDETYTMQGEPLGGGLYRFPLTPKYGPAWDVEQNYAQQRLELAEELALRELEHAWERRRYGTADFSALCTVEYADWAGAPLGTWSAELE